jgi:hypothetical protein
MRGNLDPNFNRHLSSCRASHQASAIDSGHTVKQIILRAQRLQGNSRAGKCIIPSMAVTDGRPTTLFFEVCFDGLPISAREIRKST